MSLTILYRQGELPSVSLSICIAEPLQVSSYLNFLCNHRHHALQTSTTLQGQPPFCSEFATSLINHQLHNVLSDDLRDSYGLHIVRKERPYDNVHLERDESNISMSNIIVPNPRVGQCPRCKHFSRSS